MLKRILLAGAFFALISTGAGAADVPDEPAAYDWSGFYVGAQAGYGWGDSKHFWDVTDAQTGDYDIDGFVGGGALGYNFQLDQFVLGLEADFSYADI